MGWEGRRRQDAFKWGLHMGGELRKVEQEGEGGVGEVVSWLKVRKLNPL